MLIARTPMSVSQLASPNPPTLLHSALEGRSEWNSSIQALTAAAGSAMGRERNRDPQRTAHAAGRATTRRRRVRPTPTQTPRPTRTVTSPARIVTPVTTTCPESTPPVARTTTAPNHEASPPTRRVQPARDVSAPCSLKRRNVKAAPTSGPATGTDTESALAAKVVAIIDEVRTRLPPTRSSRRCIKAKVVMDNTSRAIPRAIHDHWGWPILPKDLASAERLPSTSTTNAATVATDNPPRRRRARCGRFVASALAPLSDSDPAAASPRTVLEPFRSGLA